MAVLDSSRSGILSSACNACHPSQASERYRRADNGREKILDFLVGYSDLIKRSARLSAAMST